MNFLKKNLKKRQQPKTSDDVSVVFITNKKLSEPQKDAIETIIKNAVKANEDIVSIEILITMNTGIDAVINLNGSTNSIEVNI